MLHPNKQEKNTDDYSKACKDLEPAQKCHHSSQEPSTK